MNGLLQNLVNQMLQGTLRNNPQMQQFDQMMSGKDPHQQWQTLMNLAKSRGFDVNAKMFSESDLRSLGLKTSTWGR